MAKSKYAAAGGLLGLVLLLVASGFGLLAFRDQSFSLEALIVGGVLCVLFSVHYLLCMSFFPGLDPYPIIIAYILSALGMILLWRSNPDIGQKQLIWVGAGLIGMLVVMLVLRNIQFWVRLKWVLMAASMGILLVTLVIGNAQGGAKNWIDIGGFSFQPSEFIKIVLIYVLASELSEKRRLGQLLWPLAVFAVGCVGLLVLARDLGGALLYASTSLILFYVATGNWLVTGAGLLAGAGGSVLAFKLFDHVKVRVAAWRNPWASYESSGFQIAHGLMAIASGGLFGRGLTLGKVKIIPAYYTDYIFTVLCLEMGQIVGVAVIGFYVLLILRGIAAAMQSPNQFNALLATGVIAMLAMQTFLILGGVMKMIPLTGVTLPFVSYGGSSMIGSFFLLGILEAVILNNQRNHE